jgi:hypothetical protein
METLQRTANRGSISTGYDIDNSLKLEADDSQYIDDRHYVAGNRKKLTISFWFKRTELGQTQMPYEQSALQARIYLRNTDDLYITAYDNSGWTIITNRVFRDTSAWYHCVFQLDTTQSTAADRMKLWINGQQETSFSSASYPTQNADTFFNTNQSAKVGGGGAGLYFSGYMSEFFFIDDQALQASDFGEYDSDSGIWIPKEYDGTFGGQSYYLEFKNASNLADRSDGLSNGVSLSVQNITSADQATDTPTNNFATWNVLPLYNSNIFSFPNGATEVDRTSGTGWTTAYSSLGANKGKWYAEFQILTSGNYLMNGNVPLAKIQSVYATQFYLGSEASAAAGAGYYSSGTTGNDAIYHDATFTDSGVTTSAGDIISVAMDCDNNKIHFAVNGTYTNSSNPATNTNGFNMTDDYQFFAHATLTGSQTWKNNFGGYTTISISSGESDANGYGTFEYAPPSGYYALCTKNLAEYG